MTTDTATLCSNCGDPCEAVTIDNSFDHDFGDKSTHVTSIESPCCQADVISQDEYEERQANEPTGAKDYADEEMAVYADSVLSVNISVERRRHLIHSLLMTAFEVGSIKGKRETNGIMKEALAANT